MEVLQFTKYFHLVPSQVCHCPYSPGLRPCALLIVGTAWTALLKRIEAKWSVQLTALCNMDLQVPAACHGRMQQSNPHSECSHAVAGSNAMSAEVMWAHALQGLRFSWQQLGEKGGFSARLRLATDADPAAARSSSVQAPPSTLTRLLVAPKVFNLAIVWESAHVSFLPSPCCLHHASARVTGKECMSVVRQFPAGQQQTDACFRCMHSLKYLLAVSLLQANSGKVSSDRVCDRIWSLTQPVGVSSIASCTICSPCWIGSRLRLPRSELRG